MTKKGLVVRLVFFLILNSFHAKQGGELSIDFNKEGTSIGIASYDLRSDSRVESFYTGGGWAYCNSIDEDSLFRVDNNFGAVLGLNKTMPRIFYNILIRKEMVCKMTII